MFFVPRKIDSKIITLCKSINKSSIAQFIKVAPVKDAQLNECVENVKKYVREKGGEAVLGWAIWINPKILLEAEFHAVYKTKENELIDITPHKGDPTEILFLEDSSLKYEGCQINNKRKNISGLKSVDRYIQILNEIFKITNKDDFKYQSVEIRLRGEELKAYSGLKNEMEMIEYELKDKLKLGPDMPCICGSGKKLKKCCLDKIIQIRNSNHQSNNYINKQFPGN